MKIQNYLALVVAFFLLVLCNSASLTAQSHGRWSVETDPATFAFHGYALHLRWQPATLDKWLFGLGAYSMDLPDLLVNLNPDNQDEGWAISIDQGYGLFAERYFRSSNDGFFLGEQVGVQRFTAENPELGAAPLAFTNLLFMTYGGFAWKPFRSSLPGLYLKPWAGLALTGKVAGENVGQGLTYEIAPVLPFVTLHLGYTF